MKKYILGAAFAILIAFTPFYNVQAQVANAQYVSLLEQLITLLEQELANLQATQTTSTPSMTETTPVAQNTTPVEVGDATTNPIQIYQLQYEPVSTTNAEDFYYWGSEAIDPTTISVTDDNGASIAVTFTVGSEADTNDCINLPSGKVCGGHWMRLVPSESFATMPGVYTFNFVGVDGQTASQTVDVTQPLQ